MSVTQKYPTAQRLADGRLSSIAKIKFIPVGMPEKLHEAAKQIVGTLRSDPAEGLITELVGDLQHSLAKEKRWRELLTEAFDTLRFTALFAAISRRRKERSTASIE